MKSRRLADTCWSAWPPAILLGLLGLCFTAGRFFQSSLMMSRDFGEGWNAGHALLWVTDHTLYYPPDALLTNNYPPLSFLAVGAMTHLGLDVLMAGRLLSAMGLVAVIVMIVLLLWRLHRDALACLVGAGVFACYMAIEIDQYVADDNPHMPALALFMLALFGVLAGRGRGWPVAAGILCAIGVFYKNNILAIPATILIWLLLTDRRAAWQFVLAGAAGSLLLLGLFEAMFGGRMLASILLGRQIGLGRALRSALRYLLPMMPLVSLAVLPAALPREGARDRVGPTLLLFLALAIALGLLQWGGAGVGINALIEPLLAASLLAGHLVARLRQGEVRWLRGWAVLAITVAVLSTPGFPPTKEILEPSWYAAQRARADEVRQVVAAIRAVPGPAVCEQQVYCFWAGKPYEVEQFNFVQGVRLGVKSEQPLLDRLEAGYFGTILWDSGLGETILTPRAMALVRARYDERPTPIRGLVLFVRRQPVSDGAAR